MTTSSRTGSVLYRVPPYVTSEEGTGLLARIAVPGVERASRG